MRSYIYYIIWTLADEINKVKNSWSNAFPVVSKPLVGGTSKSKNNYYVCHRNIV